MDIFLQQVGKKFGREWIFRNLTYTLKEGHKYALTGHNGSGKSTLLKLLSACMPCTEGQMEYAHNGSALPAERVYGHTALVAPYTAVVEEFTVLELLAFYRSFKPLALSNEAFCEKLALAGAKQKPVKHYSSGMKQRLQLGLALFSDAQLLLLDEPTSNLDKKNAQWYKDELEKPMPGRLVVISSNQAEEYGMCEEVLDLTLWKPQ